jgi:hypothetical protein
MSTIIFDRAHIYVKGNLVLNAGRRAAEFD